MPNSRELHNNISWVFWIAQFQEWLVIPFKLTILPMHSLCLVSMFSGVQPCHGVSEGGSWEGAGSGWRREPPLRALHEVVIKFPITDRKCSYRTFSIEHLVHILAQKLLSSCRRNILLLGKVGWHRVSQSAGRAAAHATFHGLCAWDSTVSQHP